MKMMEFAKSSAKIVWTYGAITGVCLSILWYVSVHLGEPVVASLLLNILPMVGFLLVGLLASKQTGRVRTGTLAGLVAGLTNMLILLALSLLQGGTKPNSFSLAMDAIAFVVALAAGAGIGTLGGLIGNMVPWINAPNSSARIVSSYGAITGVCLSILWYISINLAPDGLIRTILILVLPIVGFLLAGLLASKQTGRVRTGTLTGLIAGLIGGSIIWVVLALVPLLGLIATHGLLNVLLTAAISEVIWVVFLLGVGAGIGTLGGVIGDMSVWIGKRKAKVTPAADPMDASCSPQQESLQYPLQQQ